VVRVPRRTLGVVLSGRDGHDVRVTQDDTASRSRGEGADIDPAGSAEDPWLAGAMLDERYRAILQNIQGYAIYAVDPEGRVTEWTAGAKRIKGYEPWEVIGRSCAMFHTPEARAAGEPEAILARAAAAGRAEHESWHVRKDGSRFWAHEISTPIRDEAGGCRASPRSPRHDVQPDAGNSAEGDDRPGARGQPRRGGVHGGHVPLRQVLHNLLTNAAKYAVRAGRS